ncbi:MAG: glycerophosphodiester phosphodiesterase family protein [Rhizobiaceae bacterium]|nr:glycerophosphodiester phosphodiesterase family protein [Rhizobiaceae bacterium]
MTSSWRFIILRNALLPLVVLASSINVAAADDASIQLGPRPFFLVDDMENGDLKDKLNACKAGPFAKSDWSIGHRGAPLQFPEHTRESYIASARMGAGIIECDVTFTKDKQLVCRHAQNDLHTTTNILQTPLANACTTGFSPASGDAEATAECRTSDITLAQFRTLNGKMDAANKSAKTVDEYVNGTTSWRTDLYSAKGTLVTHAESIELIRSLGGKFTPELKTPSVEMPFDGYSQQNYAQALIDEYKAAGIPASDVFAQSFNLDDVLYWIENEPEFGKQAVYLDDSYSVVGWSPEKPETWQHTMADLKSMGVNYIAPPMWVLVKVDNGKIVPTIYSIEAKSAGLEIITWTAERSGLLKDGGGWYYQTVSDVINNDGDVYELLHVLHKDVGIKGIFSDWPATTTFYANCFGLK